MTSLRAYGWVVAAAAFVLAGAGCGGNKGSGTGGGSGASTSTSGASTSTAASSSSGQTCTNACIAQSVQCNAGELQTCVVQENGCYDWNPPTSCPSNETCSGARCVATCSDQCAVGATQCLGPELQTCAKQVNGCTDWNPAQACPSGTCSMGGCPGSTSTSSSSGTTTTSSSSSSGTTSTSSSSGTTSTSSSTSSSGTTSTSSSSSSGSTTCTPGTLQCSGSVLQVCNASGMWATQQVCSQGCDATKMQCTTTTTCTPQTTRCAGNVAEVCNSTGTAWLGVETCLASCSNGLCTGACTPGATQCSGNTPQTCNTNGTAWVSGTACTTTCVAATGACADPALTINANGNATLDGEHWINGDVTITNSSVLTSNTGVLIIHANNVTLDSTSKIVIAATGNDPRGAGTTTANTQCLAGGNYCYATGNPGTGGSYGTKGASTVNATCYGYTCSAPITPPPAYAIADSEAAPGAAGGPCTDTPSTPGQGGGLLAIYANNITIQGTITANGAAGTGCAGGGSGGGVLLQATGALVFSGSISVAGGNGGPGPASGAAGGAGGSGMAKLLYGMSNTITGTVVGAKLHSFMPPFDVGSATHPSSARWYNDAYPSFDLAWSKPFGNSSGYYYILDTTYGHVPSPVNAMFLAGEASSFMPAALVTGTNYFHVDTVGPSANVGTVEARFVVNINSTPPGITSPSHPTPGTWYNNNSPYFTWVVPHLNADVSNFYWVFDPYASTIPDKTANKIPMDLMNGQNSKQLLLPNQMNGIWYLHVIAEDTMGYLTKAGASFRVQIGTDPGQGSVSGTITDAATGKPLQGVTVTLNRGAVTPVQVTNTNGQYAYTNNVYAQQYEIRASLSGYKDAVQTITVTKGMTTVVPLTLGM